ncbi:MAG: hypothetical protein SPL30_09560 [Succinivibrio sp.]|nr:hypothetical protein [Succinivibrio sp.]
MNDTLPHPEALAARSEQISVTALDGCCAQTYTLMSALLSDTVKAAPRMDSRYPELLRELMRLLMQAQQRDDLVAISDLLGFDLPYVLRNCRKGAHSK